MKNSVDTRQIITWSVVILAILGLFIGLAILGGGAGSTVGTLGIPVNEATDHIRGPNTAKATLIEYSDFQCPACGQYESIVREVASSFPNDLRLVYRHFPLTDLHPHAFPAAIASEAAQKQGKFWEMHDMLFDRQSQWVEATSTDQLFIDYAVSLGLDKTKFIADEADSATADKVTTDLSGGESEGINATPTFYLNGVQIQPQSLQEFKSLVQTAIDSAKK